MERIGFNPVTQEDEVNGYVHKSDLDIDGLNVFDFTDKDVLCWLAELMKHRDADNSRRSSIALNQKKHLSIFAVRRVSRRR